MRALTTLILAAALAQAAHAAAPQKAALRRTAASTASLPLPASPLQALMARPRAPAGITLNAPYGLAVDTAGRLYVCNAFGNSVTIYDTSRTLVGTIATGLDIPTAVQVAVDGTIYVASNANNTISTYNQQLAEIDSFTDGTAANPINMELAANGSLWVLDAMGVLHAYVQNRPIGTTATNGTAVGPWGSNITVYGAPDGNGGYLEYYQNLADALHNGTYFPTVFGSATRAGGVAEDAFAQQYITNLDTNQVTIWDSTNANQIGTVPVTVGSVGIAVDSAHARFYVSNPTLNTVTVYSTGSSHKILGIIR